MSSRLYAVSETGICPACGYRRDSREHLHHVPRNRWPENLTRRKQRVVVDGLVVDAPEVIDNQTIFLDDLTCECGYVATSEAALRMHRRRSKAHRET